MSSMQLSAAHVDGADIPGVPAEGSAGQKGATFGSESDVIQTLLVNIICL